MFELLTLFLTGGGSAAMGSILKGVFGMLTDSRQQKYEIEMAREAQTMSSQLSSRKASTAVMVVLLLAQLVGCSRSLEWAQSHSSHASQQFSLQSHSSVQQILQGKEKQRYFSDSSVFRQSKPIWSSQQDTSASSKPQSCCR